ncbi:hypothetical protein [Labrys sp. (in: a-proteobacteria)]|uniref:hypothetical protein n=1 Tax=Labrys sp. (in: a-proteobacteria) TaxID=1917972 RepID=UPI0039E299ED
MKYMNHMAFNSRGTEDTQWLNLDPRTIRREIEERKRHEDAAPKNWKRAHGEINSKESMTYFHSECPNSYIYVFRGLSYRGDGETAISLHLPSLAGRIVKDILRNNSPLGKDCAYDPWIEKDEYLICRSWDRHPRQSRDHTAYGFSAYVLPELKYLRNRNDSIDISEVFMCIDSFEVYV